MLSKKASFAAQLGRFYFVRNLFQGRQQYFRPALLDAFVVG